MRPAVEWNTANHKPMLQPIQRTGPKFIHGAWLLGGARGGANRGVFFTRHCSTLMLPPADKWDSDQNLRKLHGLLRWLAADRSLWPSDSARNAVPVQHRAPMFDLQRAAAASLP